MEFLPPLRQYPDRSQPLLEVNPEMLEPRSWTQLAIVALFKERIISRWYSPKLTMMARQHPPDVDHIPFIYERPGTPPGYPRDYGVIDSYFLRLWVQNEGKSRAEKVQVFVSEVLRLKRLSDQCTERNGSPTVRIVIT